MKFGPEASGVNLEEISLITGGQILVLALKKTVLASNHYLDLFGTFPADVATARVDKGRTIRTQREKEGKKEGKMKPAVKNQRD